MKNCYSRLAIILAAALSVIHLHAQIYDRHAIDGTATGLSFGSRMTSGNFNGDAFQDLLVARSPGVRPDTAVFLFLGSATFPNGINSDTDASLVFTIPEFGTTNDDFFGKDLAMGDVNGNGIDDVLITAPDDYPYGGTADSVGDQHLGAAYVFFGGLSTNAEADVVIIGKSVAPGALQSSILILGQAIAVGDVVGSDGVDDIIVAATNQTQNYSEIYIFPGSTQLGADPLWQLFADTDAVVTISINDVIDSLSIGDINGDTHDDIIIRDQVGDNMSAWVVYGQTTLPPIIGESDVDLTFSFDSATSTDRTILAEEAGDLNGDGIDDVVFATTRNDSGTGIAQNNVYVHSGTTLAGGSDTPSVQTTFPIIDRRGTALSIGQLNDGPDDLLIGNNLGGGLAYLYHGSSDFISRPIGFVPPPDVILLPDNPDERFGTTVEIAGNMNNFAPGEFAVGAPSSDRGGDGAGTVYLFLNSGVELPNVDLTPCDTFWARSPVGWQFCGSIFMELFLEDVEFIGLFSRDLCDPNNPNEFREVTSAYTLELIQPGPNDPTGTRLHLTIKGDQKPFDDLHLALAPTNPNNLSGFVEISYLTNQGNLISVGPKLLDLSDVGMEGDLNGDRVLDVKDRKLLQAAIGTCNGDNPFLADADFDEDGCITQADHKLWIKLFVEFTKRNTH